jgi:hypothetical protein
MCVNLITTSVIGAKKMTPSPLRMTASANDHAISVPGFSA